MGGTGGEAGLDNSTLPVNLGLGPRFSFYLCRAGGFYLTVQISFVSVSVSMSDGVCVRARACVCML